MSKTPITRPFANQPRAHFDFLMSMLVLMASLGLALFLLWAASRIAGLQTFEQLPAWLKSGYGQLFTAIITGGSLLGILIKAKEDPEGPNYLLWILGIAFGFCLVIVGLSAVLKPKSIVVPDPHPDPKLNTGPAPAPPPFHHRYIPNVGGYMMFDEKQKMVVSDPASRGPENFSIEVDDLPRAGAYNVDAMWTAAVPTEVWVYYKDLPTCADTSMNKAAIHFLPEVQGGWGRGSLPSIPQRVGVMLLPKGHSTITFTARSCIGDKIPTTEWIELTEIP